MLGLKALLDRLDFLNVLRFRKDVNGQTVLVGANGAVLLTIDPNSNILANLIPRHDTLANLLVTQGGQYEIGVATDQNALVKFSGAAGGVGNIVFRRDSFLGTATATAIAAQPVGTTATMLDLTAVKTDEVGAIDLTNNWILIPAGAKKMRMSAYGLFAAGAGAFRELRIIANFLQIQTSAMASATLTTKVAISTELINLEDNGLVAGVDSVALTAYQDSGAPLNISNARLSVDFYE